MRRYLVIFSILFGLSLQVFSAESLKVAVAANFIPAMEALKKEFLKNNPGAGITIISGSSGKLATQIFQGADFDLFVSADTDYPVKIADKGFAAGSPAIYAVGKLVMVTVRPIDLSPGIQIVTNSVVHRLVTANPALAPYGRAAVEALSNSGLLAVTNKMIFTENINQAMSAVMTSVEVGFTARSLLFTPYTLKYNVEGKYFVEVDPNLYSPLEQSMILLKNGKNPELAQSFFDFILSASGKEMIARYGYSQK